MTKVRIASLAIGGVMILTGIAVPVALASDPVGAVPSGHQLSLSHLTNNSTNIEGTARVSFSCIASADTFDLTMQNVNVVDSNGNSFIGGTVAIGMELQGPAEALAFPVTQDPRTGLWGATVSGSLVHSVDCAADTVWTFEDIRADGAFSIGGTLNNGS